MSTGVIRYRTIDNAGAAGLLAQTDFTNSTNKTSSETTSRDKCQNEIAVTVNEKLSTNLPMMMG